MLLNWTCLGVTWNSEIWVSGCWAQCDPGRFWQTIGFGKRKEWFGILYLHTNCPKKTITFQNVYLLFLFNEIEQKQPVITSHVLKPVQSAQIRLPIRYIFNAKERNSMQKPLVGRSPLVHIA